jgi:hypothetical protein
VADLDFFLEQPGGTFRVIPVESIDLSAFGTDPEPSFGFPRQVFFHDTLLVSVLSFDTSRFQSFTSEEAGDAQALVSFSICLAYSSFSCGVLSGIGTSLDENVSCETF